jgi:hypothetical protein
VTFFGRHPGWLVSPFTIINAITGKLWPLGNDVTFIPGHGPTSTFGHERRTNPHVGDTALA